MIKFEDLGLSPETLAVLKAKGFEEPTPIQAQAIPALLTGTKDIVGQSQTGTGKTAAFGLPILEKMDPNSRDVQAIVLTPTRELAIQVAEEINSLKANSKFRVIPIYGGQSIDLQFKRLRSGVSIVVGTPGRIMDHIKRKTLKIDNISHFILDEADEMLDMGFLDDIKTIMSHTNKEKRSLLFSATMSREILKIIKNYMNDYDLIKVTQEEITTSNINQIYFEVTKNNRFEALCRIIDIEVEFYGIVFCRTKQDVDTISHQLLARGYDVDALHGDISQSMREKVLNRFKKKMVTILIATDVAARGIDVNDLTHVINYSLPQDSKSYVHRIGRTGRAGKEGHAITFVTPDEQRKLQYIRKSTKAEINKAHLPKVKELIETKKKRVMETLYTLIDETPKEDYLEIAQGLLTRNSAEECLANLLEHTFQSELSTDKYKEIENTYVDTKGRTKLFITHGKKDGLTKPQLVDIIKEKCKISDDKIRNIEILDSFSFVTLPFSDAEILLTHFKEKGARTDLSFEKAKPSKRTNTARRSFRDNGGYKGRSGKGYRGQGGSGGGRKKSFKKSSSKSYSK